MAFLTTLSLGYGLFRDGFKVSLLKVLLFVGLLIFTFVILPAVLTIKQSLPNPKRYVFMRSADRFNNEFIVPCVLSLIFIVFATTSWESGAAREQADRILTVFFDVIHFIFAR